MLLAIPFGSSSTVGPQGPPGVRGPQGPFGLGTQGPQGAPGAGIAGPQGFPGAGIQGPQGATGVGVQGPQGNVGVGSQGPQGIQGATGNSPAGAISATATPSATLNLAGNPPDWVILSQFNRITRAAGIVSFQTRFTIRGTTPYNAAQFITIDILLPHATFGTPRRLNLGDDTIASGPSYVSTQTTPTRSGVDIILTTPGDDTYQCAFGFTGTLPANTDIIVEYDCTWSTQ